MFSSLDYDKFRALRISHVAARFEELIRDENNDMLVVTNDAIVVWSAYAHDGMMAMDAMAPMSDGMMAKQGVKHDGVVRVYDAGTEANTELCAHIPGPPCGNKGARVTDGAEGFVGPHSGILGVGDLDPRVVGWLHPVLEVSVER